MIGLALRETTFITVIEFFMQYSETSEPTYHASLDEARISSICKDLVSFRFLQGVVEALY